MARSGKWYRKNEADVMNKLGLKETPGSGAGWIHKEDGENEYILAQLKSTDAERITIKMDDWRKVVYHANVSHKIPIFVNEKIGEEILITMRPQDIIQVANYLNGEAMEIHSKDYINELVKTSTQRKSQGSKVRSSSKGRNKFFEEREKQFNKRRK